MEVIERGEPRSLNPRLASALLGGFHQRTDGDYYASIEIVRELPADIAKTRRFRRTTADPATKKFVRPSAEDIDDCRTVQLARDYIEQVEIYLPAPVAPTVKATASSPVLWVIGSLVTAFALGVAVAFLLA